MQTGPGRHRIPGEAVEGFQLRRCPRIAQHALSDLLKRLSWLDNDCRTRCGEHGGDGERAETHWNTISLPARTVAVGVFTEMDCFAGSSSSASSRPCKSVRSLRS